MATYATNVSKQRTHAPDAIARLHSTLLRLLVDPAVVDPYTEKFQRQLAAIVPHSTTGIAHTKIIHGWIFMASLAWK